MANQSLPANHAAAVKIEIPSPPFRNQPTTHLQPNPLYPSSASSSSHLDPQLILIVLVYPEWLWQLVVDHHDGSPQCQWIMTMDCGLCYVGMAGEKLSSTPWEAERRVRESANKQGSVTESLFQGDI
ncbi:unnamed protein product [Pleuronectes platessa]|uniref:Uncharacterized protein n=1 Tax=Pleuronectes platessa TaxID=8262 RepID=A0A9N7Y601_PLEPL|nr:unnamed protein product [Pleuronectes platessa]